VPIFSSSPRDLGAMAIGSSGSGIDGAGSTTGSSLAQSVSPVEVSASLATAPMSPAGRVSTGSWFLPRSTSRWPIRSSLPLWTFHTWLSALKVPEYTRT
jgi:hypothetical protein